MRSRYRGSLAAAVLVLAACASPQQKIEKAFGYPTVAAAFEALKARKDVKMTSQDGWTIIEDPASSTLWSFAPPNHPAYPAVIRRRLVERDGGKVGEMTALCQATRTACDKLMADVRGESGGESGAEGAPR
jgi:hypothetical protein